MPRTTGPSEREIQRQVLEWLTMHGFWVWRANSGAVTATHKGKTRFVRFNGARGCSDLVGLVPGTGQFLAVELKRPGQQPTPDQQGFLDAVRRQGGVALCVHSVDELIEGLKAQGVGS